MERTLDTMKPQTTSTTSPSTSKPIEKWITENFTELETSHETEISTTYEARDKITREKVLLQVTKVTRNSTFEIFRNGINYGIKLANTAHIIKSEKLFFDEKNNQICYSTKLGKTLVDMLHLGNPLTITRSVKLLKNLVGALLAAKELLNISHNNLKPSNIVFINGEEHIGGWERSLTPMDQLKKITRDVLSYNNYSFQAPEMTKEASLKSIDLSKADVYSLGLIFLYARGMSELQIKSLRSISTFSSCFTSEALLCKGGEKFEHTKQIKQILTQMLAKSPQDRITLENLKEKLELIPLRVEKTEAEEEDIEIDNIVNSLFQTAQNEFNSKNYAKSLELYETCLDLFRGTRDSTEHPLYAHCLIGIGHVLNSQGRLYEAVERYSEAQQIFKRKFGGNHPDVATCLFNKATVLLKQNSFTEALRHFEKSMMLYSSNFGSRSSKAADCVIGIGDVYYNQGKEEEALKKYYEALDMKRKKCRNFHPDIAECFSKIADILKKQGKYVHAMSNLEESLRIYQNYYGENHHQVAVTLNNLGVILKKMGKMQESMKKYEESMQIYISCYGKWHPKVADCLYNMAINLKNQGEIEKSLEKYDQSLEIYRKCFGDFHPEVIIVLEAIDNLIKNRAKKYHKSD